MPFYLAARYSRRLELCGYKENLERMGYRVHARWLAGDHQIADDGTPIGDAGERAVESGDPAGADLRRKFLHDDLEDVFACTTFVAFTGAGRSRGGRHVEFGIALARFLREHPQSGSPPFSSNRPPRIESLMIVGPRENLFYWHPAIIVFDTPQAFLSYFNAGRSGG